MGAKEKMDNSLAQHILRAKQPPLHHITLENLPNLDRESLTDQLSALCEISNFHWWEYVKLGRFGTDKVAGKGDGHREEQTGKQRVRFCSHLLFSFHEEETELREGEYSFSTRYIPTSPRNRLMYFTLNEQEKDLQSCIARITATDRGDQAYFSDPVPQDAAEEFDEGPPTKKRRKHAGRVLRVPTSDLQEVLDIGALNYNSSRKLFTTFSEQLVADGDIQWRDHQDDQDTVVLPDYDPETGEMLPCSFVHVTSFLSETGDLLMRCTCKIYNLLQKTILHKLPLQPGVDGEDFLAESNTCMHCRFFKSNLRTCVVSIGESDRAGLTLSLLQKKVKQSLPGVNDPVLLLGDVMSHGSTKFSIQGDTDFAIVSISFRLGMCFARCLNGVCSAQARNKKRVPKVIPLDQQHHHCSHLRTLFQHLDFIHSLFPEFFQADEDNDLEEGEEGIAAPAEGENLDDVVLNTKQVKGNFNVDTGLWEYPAVSIFKPSEEDEPTFAL